MSLANKPAKTNSDKPAKKQNGAKPAKTNSDKPAKKQNGAKPAKKQNGAKPAKKQKVNDNNDEPGKRLAPRSRNGANASTATIDPHVFRQASSSDTFAISTVARRLPLSPRGFNHQQQNKDKPTKKRKVRDNNKPAALEDDNKPAALENDSKPAALEDDSKKSSETIIASKNASKNTRAKKRAKITAKATKKNPPKDTSAAPKATTNPPDIEEVDEAETQNQTGRAARCARGKHKYLELSDPKDDDCSDYCEDDEDEDDEFLQPDRKPAARPSKRPPKTTAINYTLSTEEATMVHTLVQQYDTIPTTTIEGVVIGSGCDEEVCKLFLEYYRYGKSVDDNDDEATKDDDFDFDFAVLLPDETAFTTADAKVCAINHRGKHCQVVRDISREPCFQMTDRIVESYSLTFGDTYFSKGIKDTQTFPADSSRTPVLYAKPKDDPQAVGKVGSSKQIQGRYKEEPEDVLQSIMILHNMDRQLRDEDDTDE